MKTSLVAITVFVFMTFLHFSASAYAADSCQPVFDSITKIVTTPSHSYTTETSPFTNGHPRSSETIYFNGKVYIRARDKWILSPVTAAEVLEQEKENRATAKGTCQLVRNETVNGEVAMVYSMHQETEIGKEDAQLWVSKATGLALREEVDLGGAGGKKHRSARFEYSKVHPPM